jgi:SAM-dependent methyltransferase
VTNTSKRVVGHLRDAAKHWRQSAVGACPICGPTIFVCTGSWLRDDLRCARCRSIPRERAVVCVLSEIAPGWRASRLHEFSPGGAASRFLASSGAYTASHFPDEDLQALSFADESFDLVVTQDVMEHVVDPDRAFSEIARVLRPGGIHVFTVPLHPDPTNVRVATDGTLLAPAEYHADPAAPDQGTLVVREWGHDIVDHCGLPTEIVHFDDARRGLRGEHLDVLVSRAA